MNLLFKFSGEFFSSHEELSQEGIILLNAIKEIKLSSGYVVVGGGNRVRGKNSNISRNSADKLGVISTIFNAFILQEHFSMIGFNSIVFSHFNDFGMKYSINDAMSAFDRDMWVVLSGGLGNVGYVSTDLNSVIKALELNVDAMIKITKVDGLFDRSPDLDGATLISKISHKEALEKRLAIIDLSALEVAAENDLPIGICSVNNFVDFLNGESVGSIIGYDWRK